MTHAKHGRRSSRSRRSWALAAIPVGVVASSLVVWQASYAAFSSVTTNGANTISTGTVTLSNSSAASHTLVSNLVPSSTVGTYCVLVEYTGDVGTTVKFYSKNNNPTMSAEETELANAVLVSLQMDGADTNDLAAPTGDTCRDRTPMTALATLPLTGGGSAKTATQLFSATDWDSGHNVSWTPSSSGQKRMFRFTYNLPTSVNDNDLQGQTLNFDLIWEAQNS